MSNNKNNFTDSITDKRCIPYNITKQGTINTFGKNVQGSDGLTYNTLVGTPVVGTIVTGSTSKAYGTIYSDTGTIFYLSDINGVFTNGEVLSGPGFTAVVNGVPTYTLFTKQCMVGDFIYNAAQTEVHKIVFISNDLSMQIQEAFGSNLVNQSLIISPCVPRPKEIAILIPTGNAAGLIDGVSIPAGVSWDASKLSQNMTSTGLGNYIDSVIVDATGTVMIIQINY